MLQSIYVKNFKAWRKGVFKFFGKSATLVGENDAGKTSILEALDFFFNRDRMDPRCFNDPQRDVEIGVRVGGQNFRKIYDRRTFDARLEESDADWSAIDPIRYVYIPVTGRSASAVALELARARMAEEVMGGAAPGGDFGGNAGPGRGGELQSAVAAAGARVLEGLPGGAGEGMRVATCLPGAIRPAPTAPRGTDVKQMLSGGTYRYAILAIDDVEDSRLADAGASEVAALAEGVGQLIVSTHTHDMVSPGGDMIIYTVGETPGAHVAGTIAGGRGGKAPGAGGGRLFMIVEGQYDLPWYKRAVELLRLGDEVQVLPGGGSNVDALCRELRALGYRCIIVRDGDMAQKARPAEGDFAIERDCIEMYAPDKLLLDCFGIVPGRTKGEFFEEIARNRRAPGANGKARKSRLAPDDIKSIIAEHIEGYLARDDDFVRELEAILETTRPVS